MGAASQFRNSSGERVNVNICGKSLAININCAEIKFRTTGIKERLMHDSDQYISIL